MEEGWIEYLSSLNLVCPATTSKSSCLKEPSCTCTPVAALSPTLKRLYLTTMSIPSTRYLLLICKGRYEVRERK